METILEVLLALEKIFGLFVFIFVCTVVAFLPILYNKHYKGWSIKDRIQSVYWRFWKSPHPGTSGAVFKTTVIGIFWVVLACTPIMLMMFVYQN